MHEQIASGPARDFWRGFARPIVAAFDAIMAWQDRGAARRRLRTLDERMLKDLGISRCDAEREGRKPFWRP